MPVSSLVEACLHSFVASTSAQATTLSRVHIEIQAQHRPDRLKKPRTRSVRPRTESVGTDRIRRFCAENRDDASKDIPLGIYFGVSVGALNEH